MHLYFGKEVYWYKDSSYAIVDILIPSCKELCDLVPLLQEIKNNSSNFRLIVASNPGKSAAYNRNRCLEASEAPFVIMMDDDISGLYPGWDLELITSLQLDAAISIVSARLLQPDGYTPGPMMSSKKDLSGDFEKVPKVPSACVAFAQTDYRFDERFKGSGFEDDAFCLHMATKGRIVIDNRVRLIHANEMKNQRDNWEYNKRHFEETYGGQTGGANE